ncbi:DUF4179 domain-containing protein [Corynebacterium sp. H130]|uniref:DUF4179 domain-containing protein n=1 Tax=Corynebacterium sp. H130 TaxID=3133444 RepID=UPI0030B1D7DC
MLDRDTLIREQLATEYEQIGLSEARKQQLIVSLAPRKRTPAFAWRRGTSRVLIAGTAALALAGSAVAVTSSTGITPAEMASDLFGQPAKTEIVDKIGRPIGASDTSNGVRITADSIIGDARNFAVVYTIEKEDGSAFDLPEPSDSGLLRLNFQHSMTRIPGDAGLGGSAYFFDRDPGDNAIQYVEQSSVFGIDSLQGKTAKVKLKDLSSVGGTIVAEGTWKLSFDIGYEEMSKELPAGQRAGETTVTRAEASPLAINLEYEGPNSQLGPAEATLIGGNAIPLTSGPLSCHQTLGKQQCSTSLSFPHLMDPEQVQELRLN